MRGKINKLLPENLITIRSYSLVLPGDFGGIMKRILLLFLTLIPAFSIFSSAQELTGIWRGYFITDGLEQYRYEVQIEQNRNSLSGVTYSYLDKRFYGKATFTGNFNKISQNALVQEIKTVEVRMSSSSFSCIQKCQLTYTKSGKEEFLEGTFTSIVERTDTLRGAFRGDDCGGGKMYLRKVSTSDFYLEPFLRKRTAPQTETPGPPVVKNAPSNTKPPVTNKTKNTNKNVTSVRPKIDSVKKAEDPVTKTDLPKNIIPKPAILKTRENNLVKTIIVNVEEVSVRLYDNGEIDDDTISVYLDNKLVLSKQRLTAAALTIKLKMDEQNPEHELVMWADNLGRIPPNTSLMIVTAGDKQYQVQITSTEQKSAAVKFRYVKQPHP